jgi:hypothetical protein
MQPEKALTLEVETDAAGGSVVCIPGMRERTCIDGSDSWREIQSKFPYLGSELLGKRWEECESGHHDVAIPNMSTVSERVSFTSDLTHASKCCCLFWIFESVLRADHFFSNARLLYS